MLSKLRLISSANPILMVLCGAFLISFSAVWVQLANVPAATSAFYRVFFGFLFLVPIAFWGGELKHLPPRLLWPAIPCAIAFALDLFFWHASIGYIGPGLATVIGNFQVFFMAACGFFFFGELLKARYLLALPLAFFGLFLVIGFDWNALPQSYKTGVLYGFLTALCYTAYLLLLRKIQADERVRSRYTPLMLVSFFTSCCLAVWLLCSGTSLAIPTVADWIYLLCLGLFSQTIGWIMIANGIPKIRPSFTGLILLLQPALSFIWDVLFFSRPTAPVHWIGIIVTLTAIYMGLTGKEKST